MKHRKPARSCADASAGPEPFWRKPLAELNSQEWESLCDGCGRCCLVKLEDEDTGKIHYTDLSCALLDVRSCRCGDYAKRFDKVPDCVRLTLEAVAKINWLPPTCAYRLRAEGRDLPDWHPLISGDPATVHVAGVSVQGRVAASENDVELDDFPEYIVSWPGKWPTKGPRRSKRVGV